MYPKRLLYQVSVFLLTFIGFAWIHANRKVFSNVKSTIVEEWTPSFSNATYNKTLPDDVWNDHCLFQDEDGAEYFLGSLDTVFMFAYAVGLFMSGVVGDTFDLRKVLAFGMCGSAVSAFLFGVVSEWTSTYNIGFYIVFWGLAGLMQSTAWPGMVAVMGNWFGRSSRGTVLGVWSSCASVGNIIGSLIVSRVITYGYECAFFVPAIMMFCWGVFIFFGLVPNPSEVGLQTVDAEVLIVRPSERDPLLVREVGDGDGDSVNQIDKIIPYSSDEPEAISCCKAILLPGVIQYSLAYASLKFVNYAFFFWLPYYLTQQFKWTQSDADSLSIWYDIGGIVGGTIAGFVTDRLNNRAPLMEIMLLLGAPSLYVYTLSPANKTTNAALLALVGFFVGGPSNIISSAISADLGSQGSLLGNKKALSTVAGIVDGTGSVGAAIGQVLVPVLHKAFGWDALFYVFICLVLVTFACILPVAIKELRGTLCWRRRFGQSGIISDE